MGAATMDIAIEQFLEKLAAELGRSDLFEKKSEKHFFLPMDERHIEIKKTENGFVMCADLGELPEEEVESFCAHLLYANYLGQGTGSSAIGLGADGKTLALSMSITFDIDYQKFRELMEEFVNYTDYWKEEIERKKNI